MRRVSTCPTHQLTAGYLEDTGIISLVCSSLQQQDLSAPVLAGTNDGGPDGDFVSRGGHRGLGPDLDKVPGHMEEVHVVVMRLKSLTKMVI